MVLFNDSRKNKDIDIIYPDQPIIVAHQIVPDVYDEGLEMIEKINPSKTSDEIHAILEILSDSHSCAIFGKYYPIIMKYLNSIGNPTHSIVIDNTDVDGFLKIMKDIILDVDKNFIINDIMMFIYEYLISYDYINRLKTLTSIKQASQSIADGSYAICDDNDDNDEHEDDELDEDEYEEDDEEEDDDTSISESNRDKIDMYFGKINKDVLNKYCLRIDYADNKLSHFLFEKNDDSGTLTDLNNYITPEIMRVEQLSLWASTELNELGNTPEYFILYSDRDGLSVVFDYDHTLDFGHYYLALDILNNYSTLYELLEKLNIKLDRKVKTMTTDGTAISYLNPSRNVSLEYLWKSHIHILFQKKPMHRYDQIEQMLDLTEYLTPELAEREDIKFGLAIDELNAYGFFPYLYICSDKHDVSIKCRYMTHTESNDGMPDVYYQIGLTQYPSFNIFLKDADIVINEDDKLIAKKMMEYIVDIPIQVVVKSCENVTDIVDTMNTFVETVRKAKFMYVPYAEVPTFGTDKRRDMFKDIREMMLNTGKTYLPFGISIEFDVSNNGIYHSNILIIDGSTLEVMYRIPMAGVIPIDGTPIYTPTDLDVSYKFMSYVASFFGYTIKDGEVTKISE